MKHVLVTNDFPPKIGGIQTYLWELWRRLEPSSFSVISASSDPAAGAFDAEQAERGIRIERTGTRVLLPSPSLARRVNAMVEATGASLVVIDPALPLGLLGQWLRVPYGVVLHGAEVTVPGRLPVSRGLLAGVLRRAHVVICAGAYPAREARRALRHGQLEVVEVPPGVDLERFRPLGPAERRVTRERLGIPADARLVLSVSRLVPRKGMDVLIEAAAALRGSFPDLLVAIAGVGRDSARLELLAAKTRSPVRFLGFVEDSSLPDLYSASDLFVMACRDRWAGLEQEGFGIVFLEAAASGVPQVAGRSGGADEAVLDGETGLVVDRPGDPSRLAAAVRQLLVDDALRRRMGEAARHRAESCFGYDLLSRRLAAALAGVEG